MLMLITASLKPVDNEYGVVYCGADHASLITTIQYAQMKLS